MASDSPSSALNLPPKWGISQLTLHFEGDDLKKDETPFAGTLLTQLRFDITPGTEFSTVRDGDLATLKRTLPDFQLIGSGEVEVAGKPAGFIEGIYEDPTVGRLHQLILYLRRGERMYTVTGTHRAERFGKVRDDIMAFAQDLAR